MRPLPRALRLKSPSTARRAAFACAALCALLILSQRARAGGAAPTARALFDLGCTLMSAGRYAEACPKLEESLRLEPGMGARFNLAYCWEHSGRTASAWALYLAVAAAARGAGMSEREAVARQSAAEVERKLSYLVIQVGEKARGLQVSRDGVVLGPATWGTRAPVDPGSHWLGATAPGKRPWRAIVNVPAAAGAYAVSVPPLADVPVPPLSARAWLGIASGTAAVAATAFGSVLARRVANTQQQARRLCPDYGSAAYQGCSSGDIRMHNELLTNARSLRVQAIVGFSLGAALALGSGILLLAGGGSEEPLLAIDWRLAPDAFGPALSGQW